MSEVKKVITVAERSTKALVKVVADGQKLFSDLASLAGSTVTLTEEIEFKQGQLADIENQIAASERESKASACNRTRRQGSGRADESTRLCRYHSR